MSSQHDSARYSCQLCAKYFHRLQGPFAIWGNAQHQTPSPWGSLLYNSWRKVVLCLPLPHRKLIGSVFSSYQLLAARDWADIRSANWMFLPGFWVVGCNMNLEGIIHGGGTLWQWLQLSVVMALVSSSGCVLPRCFSCGQLWIPWLWLVFQVF